MASLAFADELGHSPVCKPRPCTEIVHALAIQLHRPVAAPSSPGSNPTMHDTCAASRIYQELSQSVRLSSQQVHGGHFLPQHQGMARALLRKDRTIASCCGFSLPAQGPSHMSPLPTETARGCTTWLTHSLVRLKTPCSEASHSLACQPDGLGAPTEVPKGRNPVMHCGTVT
ncbi:hypothetical protein ASPVEDRAFT_837410 [Aspergillus versicolor CBS 583.65]|uniref:Uncharacterized protein n=1 Tax=Aspergillus versicolor CBS 583.65 TaxID=1036611 RepID=A0A1L9PUY8_ASPVE|nr:uncharacterized protein ASPVEDRAFT_837410 [Aspergillus versicolor CBS 583.65]OJJ05246.1 hypothetical protein ASPVEDRAFT_837410 [Aspergillus versicolor CBS 583.65]